MIFDRAVHQRHLIVVRCKELDEFDIIAKPVRWHDTVDVVELDEHARPAFHLKLDPEAIVSVKYTL